MTLTKDEEDEIVTLGLKVITNVTQGINAFKYSQYSRGNENFTQVLSDIKKILVLTE